MRSGERDPRDYSTSDLRAVICFRFDNVDDKGVKHHSPQKAFIMLRFFWNGDVPFNHSQQRSTMTLKLV